MLVYERREVPSVRGGCGRARVDQILRFGWWTRAKIDPWNSLRSRHKATESAGRTAQFGRMHPAGAVDAFRGSRVRTNVMNPMRPEK